MPGPHLYGGRLLWPIAQLREVLIAFRVACLRAPDELTQWCGAIRFPTLPSVPEALRGQAFASVALTYVGAADEAERHLRPLREVSGIAADLVRSLPMSQLGQVAQEPTDPMPIMTTSMFLG